MGPRVQKLKIILSWIVVVLGALTGLLFLAGMGASWIPSTNTSDPRWYPDWYEYVGGFIYAFGLLIGSLFAPYSRKLAGRIFFALIPFAAFCIAYPGSGFRYAGPTDARMFEPLAQWLAIAVAVAFYAPFVALVAALRYRKRAFYIATILALLVAVIVFTFSDLPVLVPRLAEWSVPFLALGLFWFGTGKLGWRKLIAHGPRTPIRRIFLIAKYCCAVLLLDIVLTFVIFSAFRSSDPGECNVRTPFAYPQNSNQVAFTAHIVHVPWPEQFPNGEWVGATAFARVDEKFWGMPWWFPQIVFLRYHLFQPHQSYFIDGERAHGLVTRFLPIIEAVSCGRTNLESQAVIDLKLMKSPPSRGTTSLIGFVERFQGKGTMFAPPVPYPGAKVSVSGATEHRILSTDSSGIFRIDGLSPGAYEVQPLLPDTEIVGDYRPVPRKVHLERDGVAGPEFRVFPNGRISGRLTDKHGHPVDAVLRVVSPQGDFDVPLAGPPNTRTDKDGTYQLNGIQPGRCIVVAYYRTEPRSSSPEIFYPGTTRLQDAKVLEIGEGQIIKGIDFSVDSPPHKP